MIRGDLENGLGENVLLSYIPLVVEIEDELN